jgi:hypothetical protein
MRRRLLIGLALGALVFGVSAVAIAAKDNRPQTDPVEATHTFRHIEGKFRLCEGQDGPYIDQRITGTGTSTGDPRLTGDLEVIGHRDITNLEKFFGTFEGRLLIRDPATGRKKVDADFQGAVAQDISQGFVHGKVLDEGVGPDEETLGAGELFANYRVTFHSSGAITAQLGGTTTDTRLPAVIQSGHCTGPWEQFEFDLPPP